MSVRECWMNKAKHWELVNDGSPAREKKIVVSQNIFIVILLDHSCSRQRTEEKWEDHRSKHRTSELTSSLVNFLLPVTSQIRMISSARCLGSRSPMKVKWTWGLVCSACRPLNFYLYDLSRRSGHTSPNGQKQKTVFWLDIDFESYCNHFGHFVGID